MGEDLAIQGECRTLIALANKAIKHLILIQSRISEKISSCDPPFLDLFKGYQLATEVLMNELRQAVVCCHVLVDYHDMIPQPLAPPGFTWQELGARIHLFISAADNWNHKIYCSFYSPMAVNRYQITFKRFERADHVQAYKNYLRDGNTHAILKAISIVPKVVTLSVKSLQEVYECILDLPLNCEYVGTGDSSGRMEQI